MALFQKPPQTPEEVEAAKPLDIPPDRVLDMDENEWYARVYRGDDIPQLTVRAVIMGSILGFFLAFTNLYIGLKTGWALGVGITACILSRAIWQWLMMMRLARTPMTILETNCAQSTASSAGYATGSAMVSAISAMLLLSATEMDPGGEHISWPVLAGWTFCLGVLGTVLAIPMKRNLINNERLKFPSGTAAAVTLQSLYSEGALAVKKARALLGAAMLGALVPVLIDLQLRTSKITSAVTGAIETVRDRALLPAASALFDWLPARGAAEVDGKLVSFKPSDWTMVMDHNPVMIAAGAIVGLRVAAYMALSGLLLIYGVGPEAYEYLWRNADGELVRAATHPGKAWKEIGIWLGVPIMVSSGLLSFALQWKTIVRAFGGLRGHAGGDGTTLPSAELHNDLVSRTEVPISWFIWGGGLGGAAVITLAQIHFGVPWYYGILAVLMTFFLALVACRATGESDITPVGAMGKLMQLTYGVLIPQSTTANVMTASITASSASSAADLLNDLKAGYLLGANPRRQFMAQFMGIFTGTIATVFGFYALVPDATKLTGANGKPPEFPAPAAQAWKAVAELFEQGIQNMHPMYQQAIFWGLALGVILVLLERALPRFRPWLPSATGIGLGLILPFNYPLSLFIGAVIAHIWTRWNKDHAESYLVPVAAGLIAGISIMGVIVALLNNLHVIDRLVAALG